MNKKICVYTCITGDYDSLNEIANPEKNIDYYCFTNNKSLTSKTWKIIQLEDSTDNWRLARKIKTIGHPIINDNYDIALWTDANIIWQKPISEFIAKYYKKETISIFKHFVRTNVRDEAIACLRLNKDTKESLLETLGFLKNQHYPDHNGLYESTVYIKNLQNPQVLQTMQIWYDVIANYSPRDQLSFPYAIWETDLKIDRIDLVVWNNPWFSVVQHSKQSGITKCNVYYGDPEQNFDFNQHFTYPLKKSEDTYKFTATIPQNTTEIEFNPAHQIGLIIQNLEISPKPKKLSFYGTTTINQNLISCITSTTIKAFGNFKKGQKLTFLVNLRQADTLLTNKTLEALWLQKDSVSADNLKILADNDILFTDNQKLLAEITALKSELNSILNSKGWQALEKARKIIPRRNHQNKS